MNDREFQPKELLEQWDRFCEEHDDDRWEAIDARIDKEAAHIAVPKQPRRPRRPLIYTASACVAAAAIVLACLPFADGWLSGVGDMVSNNPMFSDESNKVDDEELHSVGAPTSTTTDHGSSSTTTQSNEPNTTPTETIPTDTKPTLPAIRPYPSGGDGTGGGDFYPVYSGPYFKFHSIFNSFANYVYGTYPQETIEAIHAEIKASHSDPTAYSYKGTSMYYYVHRLDIPREKFEELNEREREFAKDDEYALVENVFTDEEINDIYTLSLEEFNRKYKSPMAVLVGEVLFDFDFFTDNPVETWQLYDFTVEQLQEVLDNAKDGSDDYIIGDGECLFEEKLILFAAEKAGVTIPNSGNGSYNTYVSHARWRGIGDAYYQYILQSHSKEAIDAFEALLYEELHGEDYAFKGDAVNRWVAHFEIPRADFEQINAQQKAYYKDTYGEDSFEYWDNVYTDAEIDDIYTLSLAEFNMKYANPCTLVVGEELYPFGWFLENRMSEWWEELEIREKYLEALLAEYKKVYPDEAGDIANFKEKLDEYIYHHGK